MSNKSRRFWENVKSNNNKEVVYRPREQSQLKRNGYQILRTDCWADCDAVDMIARVWKTYSSSACFIREERRIFRFPKNRDIIGLDLANLSLTYKKVMPWHLPFCNHFLQCRFYLNFQHVWWKSNKSELLVGPKWLAGIFHDRCATILAMMR